MMRLAGAILALAALPALLAGAVAAPRGDTETVRVATRPLERGRVLETGDLVEMSWPSRLLAATPAVQGAEGRALRRPLRRGEPLLQRDLRPAPLFKAGQRVELVWSRGSIRLSAPGLALEPAGAGETCRAQNLQTGGLVRGVAWEGPMIALEGKP